ncbi:DUF2637 domain-containing protein [Streptomyces flaveolus]|uniref:DUF2637 domain-containing protein n=1 Tax=Streptomyces flaveolus TaxID=67297 RepID=UPI0019C1855F|nr:DUF2637 domain-containing protein [Streptomyces flaveolus]GGQ81152.1 hypothetical protein GCM10010216_48740 [Streptomyces flaveolus]
MRDGTGESITPPTGSDRPKLTPLQRRLIGGVAAGGAVIAVIGFIGSYAAVRTLAEQKHFGRFAVLFPLGLDAGILVLLALDLLLTWLRMPLPLLRHIAWLLTAATIAFNGAAAWGDPLGVGMHAVIPVLFVAVVEAARHAIGTAADISAARHMESVRLSRWLLAPVRTFLLWRRMKLWELRSYDAVIALEQQRLVERLRLRAAYGRRWRRKAPVDVMIGYRMMRYGRPLAPIEGVVEDAPAPTAPAEQPAVAPAPQGAPALPAPPPAAPAPVAPTRPAPEPEGAPAAPAPTVQGAPEQPALDDQGDTPTTEGAPTEGERPAENDAPRDEQRPPTRAEVKAKIRALYDELDARPGEGVIVKLLEDEHRRGYPYKSRRHAQALRAEIEAGEPALLERGTDNVRALTGS